MIRELFEKQRPLVTAGVVSMLCFAGLAILSQFDGTEILGVNRWIKPMKFFVSIAIFVWTMAVYLYFLKGNEKSARFAAWGMIAVFVVEMAIITGQAARGTTSHFNTQTPLDGMLFAVMGLAILFNTLLAAYVLYLYFKAETGLPPSVLWGMRLGLLIFLAACVEGGYMSAQMGHAVGAADGGEGLRLVNWSTKGGDLRVAHFVGMHALQAVPLFAFLLDRCKARAATLQTVVFAAFYFAAFTFVFVQALLGRPFLTGF